MTDIRKKETRNFIEYKLPGISIEFVDVKERYNYTKIKEIIEEVLNNNDGCCFDLTGGKELLLTAVGEIVINCKVPVFQFDIENDELIKIANCEDLKNPQKTYFSIEEYIMLNGAKVIKSERRHLDNVFFKDVEKIWNICRNDCNLWNKQSNFFSKLESVDQNPGKLYVDVDISKLSKSEVDDTILKELEKEKLIFNYFKNDKKISFRYKNHMVKKCIVKAGNILELYGYSIANEINKEIPGFFYDIDIGVNVDWDGIIHPIYDSTKDTKNEIDLVFIKGLSIIFVSCKNGDVKKEALYELNTVAEKYGGKYAKKVLLTTHMADYLPSKDYLKQRAEDMNITVIDGVHDMDKKGFIDALKNI